MSGSVKQVSRASGRHKKAVARRSHTAVLLADFYRAGDGIDESFTAQMIVSDGDIAPEIPGMQTLWVQGVGCGLANGHFNRGGS